MAAPVLAAPETSVCLPNQTVPHLPEQGKVAFWYGWGGSSVVNDVDRCVTIAYVMNRMAGGLLGDRRSSDIIRATFDALS